MPSPQPLTAPDPIHQALALLLLVGRTLLGHIGAALPKRVARAPLTRDHRTARTLEWLAALTATIAGARTWLRTPTYIFPRFPGRYPSLTADLREQIGLPAVPPRTEAQKAGARRRYIQKVFETQPTATIARRLARRLGLTEASEAWPHALLALTQTPAAIAKAIHAQRSAPPKTHPASDTAHRVETPAPPSDAIALPPPDP